MKMNRKRIPCSISLEGGWKQYQTFDHAKAAHTQRVRRLIKHEVLSAQTEFNDCGLSCCGFEEPVEEGAARRQSPLKCSAFCQIAQYRLEGGTARRIMMLLESVDPTPVAATVIDPRYSLPIGDMSSFDVGPLKQSLRRRLDKVTTKNGGPLLVFGRVDFDLFEGSSGLEVRPHVHLIIANGVPTSLRSSLRPRLDKDAYPTLKPVVIKIVRDIGAIRYAVKSQLKGLSQDITVPGLQIARTRPTSAAQKAFDEFQLKHQLSDVLIIRGLRRSGGRIRIVT